MRTPYYLLSMFLTAGWCSGIVFSPESPAEESDQKVIEVNVDTPLEPASAIGIFLSQQGTAQIPVAEIKKVSGNKLVVSIPYREKDTPKDAMATAVLISEEGELAFADVRRVFAPEPRNSFLDIPKCAPEKITEATMEGQTALLQSLVQVRMDRRKVVQEALKNTLSGDFLIKLQKLESGFGLRYNLPLTADLPPVELIDRLSRIMEAVKGYETAPKAQSQPRNQSKKEAQ